PVGYRLLVPGLPRPVAASTELEARFVEPLPDVSASDVVGLLEYLHGRAGEAEVFQIADHTNREFTRVVVVVKATEMLGFVDTPGPLAVLTVKGKAFVAANPQKRVELWRDQLLHLRLFRDVHELLQRQTDRSIDRDFVLETIVTRMPYENYEQVFNTFVRWARYGELFVYDERTQGISLQA